MDTLSFIEQHRIIAIFRGVSGAGADRGAEALVKAGIKLMEVTMNTEGALQNVADWRKRYEGTALIGAGTVIDLEMAKQAVAAGAEFLVSPNLDEEVVRYAVEQNVPIIPGAMTPTEIVRAWKAGATAVKLFPMASLGLSYLKDVRAPLDKIPIVVTGGVNLDNIADFIAAGAIGVGLGSNLVDKKLIAAGQFNELEANARRYAEAVKSL